MAVEAAANPRRYFEIGDRVGQLTNTSFISAEAQKTQSAFAFLSQLHHRISSGERICIDIPERSLQQIVTTVVTGYANKRSLLQKIWDCFLRILCISTNLGLLEAMSHDILSMDFLPGGYSGEYIKQELGFLLNFLIRLPQTQAREFFQAQKVREAGYHPNHPIAYEPFVPYYCDPEEPSRRRDLTALTTAQCLDALQEIAWYVNTFDNAFPTTYRRHTTLQADPTLYAGIKGKDLNTVRARLDKLCLILARKADNEQNLDLTTRALSFISCIDFGHAHDEAEIERFIADIVDRCLERGEIRLALKALSRVYFEDRDAHFLHGKYDENFKKIAHSALANNELLLAYSAAASISDRSRSQRLDFLESITRAYLSRADLENALENAFTVACKIFRDFSLSDNPWERRNILLEQIAGAFDLKGNSARAEKVRAEKITNN